MEFLLDHGDSLNFNLDELTAPRPISSLPLETTSLLVSSICSKSLNDISNTVHYNAAPFFSRRNNTGVFP